MRPASYHGWQAPTARVRVFLGDPVALKNPLLKVNKIEFTMADFGLFLRSFCRKREYSMTNYEKY